MKLSRPSRFVAALIALCSILFMQLAVAAYACPELQRGQDGSAEMAAGAGPQDMGGCSGMDEMQPSLCHAHDHAGNQSMDKPATPLVQPFTPMGLVLALKPIEVAYRSFSDHPDFFLLMRATAPPLAIRNCCFRI